MAALAGVATAGLTILKDFFEINKMGAVVN